MNKNKNYYDTSKEVSLINFFEYSFEKKYTAAIIFSVITILGLMVIFFGPASKKEYSIKYEVYKSQTQERYQLINSKTEIVYNELKEFDVDIDMYKLFPKYFLNQFNNYLNNKIFLYNFFSDHFDNERNKFNNESEFIKFIYSKINSLESDISTTPLQDTEEIEFHKISIDFTTDDLKTAREFLPKLLSNVELQLKNDVTSQLIFLKNLYDQTIEQKKKIINDKITTEKNIYSVMVKKHLNYLNEQRSIAQYIEEYDSKSNIKTSNENNFPPLIPESVDLLIPDSVDLSLYFTKGLNVIEKEIEVLESRGSDYIPFIVHDDLNNLISLQSKDDRIMTETINLFHSDIINIPFITYDKDIYDVKINNRFSKSQMIIFLFLLSSILTPFLMSIILAYERTIYKKN